MNAAKKEVEPNVYAKVQWTAEDIQSLRPAWTLGECEDWLVDNEGTIEDRTIELGWEVITCLLND